MKWNHIMDIQPEHGRSIIQIDRPYEGHYPIGMRNYHQMCSFEEVLEYCKHADIPNPDFWWVYSEYFPFPDQPERLNPEALEEGFFPPPWNFYEYPEKTKGWIEFQRAMRKEPEYYLQGFDSPSSGNK